MNKIVKSSILVISLLVVRFCMADTVTIDGYTWTYRINGDTSEIYGKYENGEYVPAISPEPVGVVTIPAFFSGKPLTTIGDYSFYGCDGIIDISIPCSVTRIGSNVFRNCSEQLFDTTTIPGAQVVDGWVVGIGSPYALPGLLVLSDIRGMCDSAFANCSSIKEVRFSNELTTISKRAFNGCDRLTNVVMSCSITNIGEFAFHACTKLIGVTIPHSVLNIEESAFGLCSGLKKVMIPDSVKNLGDGAFYGCSGLESFVFPNSVTNIENHVLMGCRALSNVAIPDSILTIGIQAFQDCVSLTNVIIPASVRSIGGCAFSGCTGLIDVTMGSNVTDFSDDVYSVFSGCSAIRYVSIPQELCNVNFKKVFSSAKKTIIGVTIQEGVTQIDNETFWGCEKLAYVALPASLTSIGKWAFYGCSHLTGVLRIPKSVVYIGDSAFQYCSALTDVVFPDTALTIGSYAFANCYGLTDVIIPGGVSSIGKGAFSACQNLAEVTLDSGITCIPDSMFSSCWALTGVVIPNSVTNIGSYAFVGCSQVTNITIGSGVKHIGDKAFYGLGLLERIIVPHSVANIERDAFYDCAILKEVCLPDVLKGKLELSFNGCPDDLEQIYYSSFAVNILSEQLVTDDGGETCVELFVTNGCRCSFEWKCSCEPIRKGIMRDYISFNVDGAQLDAICGEVDWAKREFVVEGDGEHVLRWVYRKDASGAEGDDCGWMRLITIIPYVELSFLQGEASAGEPPGGLSFYADEGAVKLPGPCSLILPRHHFVGWSDGLSIYEAGTDYPCNSTATALTAVWSANELKAPDISATEVIFSNTTTLSISSEDDASYYYTMDGTVPTTNSIPYSGSFVVNDTVLIRAIATKTDYYDSPEVQLLVTKDTTTFSEAVNASALRFSTDSESGWRLVRGESPDGYAIRSGEIAHSSTSRVDAVISGDGFITFSCKVAGEMVKGEIYDGLVFCIDDVQQGDIMGNTDWETNTFEVVGDSEHRLSWLYVKDDSDEDVLPDDCAWVDEIVWVSNRKVTLTFDANGGDMQGQAVTRRLQADTIIGEMPMPILANYEFVGWFTRVIDGDMVAFDSVATTNMTLFAHWRKVVNTILFETGVEGLELESFQIEKGSAIGELPAVSRINYDFLGWFTDQEGGEQVLNDTTIFENMILYARWQCRFVFPDSSIWAEQTDGSWKSGLTLDDSMNSISLQINGSGTLSFSWKVSCEDYFIYRTQKILLDHLAFMIDGVEKLIVNGETDWERINITIEGEGSHFLTWCYIKDIEGAEGEDCAWIKDVVWEEDRSPITLFVDVQNGDDDADGLTMNTAIATLQKAIDDAKDGDTVIVADGVYPLIETHAKRIVIMSLNGYKTTVIDGEKADSCVNTAGGYGDWSNTNTTIRGFTLRNGNGLFGGGVVGGTLERCLIVGNVVNADPNYVAWTKGWGGGAYGSLLRYCTIVGNAATGWNDGEELIESKGGGACECILENCIIWNNSADVDSDCSDCETSACIAGTDPLFVNAANGDYRLMPNSPAVVDGIVIAGCETEIMSGTIPELTPAQVAAWVSNDLAARYAKSGESEADYQSRFEAKFGSDPVAAMSMPTDKKDAHGNDMYVWQDYVAGTDPTDTNSVFTATITMVGGVPVVEWSPKLSAAEESRRRYTIYGRAGLESGEAWHSPTNALDRFFTVGVEMK